MAGPMKLGILTWRKGSYVEEKTFFTHLAKEAEALNTEVFLFAPGDRLASGQFKGLVYKKGKGWTPGIFHSPHIVYDRFRNMQPQAFKKFVQFRNQTSLPFLNSRLAHKWNLHRFLQNHPNIAKWLPESLFLESTRDVYTLLRKYPTIYIKPVNGTGGRGILSISKKAEESFLIQGRDNKRRIVRKLLTTTAQLNQLISNWTKDAKYIVQQGLQLEWEPGLVTDFRLLVQKDAAGAWSITGLGGKVGTKNSATSNLHSGGKAVNPDAYLSRFLAESKRRSIFEECNSLGLLVAQVLEKKFGRLTELGIDLGIDRDGKVWIIEVNNKPGRDLFHQIGDVTTYRKAVRRPVEYARYLYDRGEA
ncbi:YheC/YheD family protein [Ammoniphilus sp. CFH 90114]|uniref:YheC/YheD family endospore coat-associated protein n=1 Tax=Ammoniphilus sp. CFH 90114 TaxID=2493665 RepID=UPI00100FB88F|nr:YheC/YheD family protein [Ammoniphilus sp. CFH 90114]RXT04811.1 YheC/YheD family protein [Ammoniphilus sp. CFH 90114]